MAWVHSQCYGAATYIKFQNIFITPKGNLIPVKQSLLTPHLPSSLVTTNLLCLWTYLCWVFPVNGIIRTVACVNWPRCCFEVHACCSVVGTSFPAECFHFVYSFISWWAFGLFPPSGYLE